MPSTIGQLLIFILLGLPGVAWLACRDRWLPRWPRTALRETMEFITISSLTSIAGLLLSLWAWEELSSFSTRAALSDLGDYYRREPPLTLAWLGSGVTVAVAISVLAAWIGYKMPFGKPKKRSNLTPWPYVFTQSSQPHGTDLDGLPENKTGKPSFLVVCHLDDGSQIAGLCVAYSDEPQLEGKRDLVLYGPRMTYPETADDSRLVAAHTYNLAVVNEQHIRWWATKLLDVKAAAAYRDGVKRLRSNQRE